MTYSEAYCNNSTGSNVNGGSDAGSPSMSDTVGTGGWVSATNIYTTVATNGSVTVGQYLSIYSGAATIAAYTARITAVSGGGGSAWVITLSATAFSGAVPTTGSTFKANCGGAWQGPTGSTSFPFGYITNALTDAAGDFIRLNGAGTNSVTAAMSQTTVGAICVQGMTSTPGDGGKWTINGGTTGASYVVLTLTSTASRIIVRDIVLQNNGSTGSANLFAIVGGNSLIERCVFNSSCGNCVSVTASDVDFVECEIYGGNQNNTAGVSGVTVSSAGAAAAFDHCAIHHNSGSNTAGILITSSSVIVTLDECIIANNGSHGVSTNGTGSIIRCNNCSIYGNGGSGITVTANACMLVANSCILVSNSLYGINYSGSYYSRAINCAYFSNTSGQTNGNVDSTGAITLSGSPFVAPTTGNFALNTTAGAGAACMASGRGSFTQTYSSYTTPSTSFPDVGAIQSNDLLPIGQITGSRNIGTY